MKASPWTLGASLFLAAGCGGTVVFDDGPGDGGGGGTTGAVTSTGPSTGPGGGDGGAGAQGPTTTTNVGPTTTITVGPTVSSVGPTTSTGPMGCGSFSDALGLPPTCDGCLEGRCCDELLDCDEGTACFRCVFEGVDCNAAQGALERFSTCLNAECNLECNGNECGPGDFQCPEGGCIPEEWVCNGFPDCPSGGDEFCGCGPGDFQCFQSGECIPGEWECDGIVDCADGTDEQFCNGGGICDSGLESGDPQLDVCLGDFCCFEFEQCTEFGSDVQGCYDCLAQGGGPQCQTALDCAYASPCLDEPGGICDSGLGTGDPQLDQCLGNNCCDPFRVCTDFGNDPQGCVDCFNGGGGPRCDEAIACFESSCSPDAVLITPPGVAYGHHGECAGWNGCGDAETCAQWACQAEGYGTLVSFGEDRPCTQWDACYLFYDGCCSGVQYDWGNWCDVQAVSEIRCAP